MHKVRTRLAALLAVLALAVGVLFTATPAFAAGTGQLTVTSTDVGFKGKEVTIYKMFSATPSADGTSAGYVLDPNWNNFFIEHSEEWSLGIDGESTDQDISNAAYKYVSGLSKDNDKAVTTFAVTARAWATTGTNAQDMVKDTQASGDTSPYTATFTNLDLGYYVVSPEAGSTDPDETESRGTDAMLVNVMDAKATIAMKSVYPTVEKTVNGENHASAQVGDEVQFTLTATVPDMTGFTAYSFAFTDMLSDGLTFKQVDSFTVGGTTLTQDDTAAQPNSYKQAVTGQSLKFEINNAYTLFKNMSGKKITLKYTVTINSNAIHINSDNPNEAKVEYSTNPDGTGSGESEPSIVHTYTFGFDMEKIDGETKHALPGATFELRADNNGSPAGTAITLVKDGESYRPATDDDTSDTVTQVTTTDTGIISFVGLAQGTYWLVETDTPDGYNLASPIKVEISATYNTDGTLDEWSVSVNDGEAIRPTQDPTGGTGIIIIEAPKFQVENNKGTLLPGTGGMGTVIFTVVGVAVVAGGAAWYVSRRRSSGAHTA